MQGQRISRWPEWLQTAQSPRHPHVLLAQIWTTPDTTNASKSQPFAWQMASHTIGTKITNHHQVSPKRTARDKVWVQVSQRISNNEYKTNHRTVCKSMRDGTTTGITWTLWSTPWRRRKTLSSNTRQSRRKYPELLKTHIAVDRNVWKIVEGYGPQTEVQHHLNSLAYQIAVLASCK